MPVSNNARENYIRSLRILADALEAEPYIPLPGNRAFHYDFVHITPDEWRDVVEAVNRVQKNSTPAQVHPTTRTQELTINLPSLSDRDGMRYPQVPGSMAFHISAFPITEATP